MVWYLYGTAVWGKTFPSLENVLWRRDLGRTKILDQGVFYKGGGGGGGICTDLSVGKDTKGHNATGKLDLTALAR